MDKVPQSKSQTCCSSRESSREEQQYLQDHIRECLLTSLHPQQLLGCFFQAQQGCSTPTQPWDPTGALGKGQDQPPHTKARDAPADTARAGGGQAIPGMRERSQLPGNADWRTVRQNRIMCMWQIQLLHAFGLTNPSLDSVLCPVD